MWSRKSLRRATRFRVLAARIAYIAQDRPDVMFSSKELCRDMAKPTAASMAKLKRLVRYLREYETCSWRFPFGCRFVAEVVRAYSDSDWAGCRVSRKSTSGGMLCIGGCCVRAWSSTQATIATSSGEAELYALVKASSEGLGFVSVARDLGVRLRMDLFVDSTAAQAIASRSGLGRTKHVDVKHLWVQEATQRGLLRVKRIPGEMNPADVLTRPHGARQLAEVLHAIGVRLEGRRGPLLFQTSGDFGAEGHLGAGVETEVPPVQACTGDGRTRWADFEEWGYDFSSPDFGPVNPAGDGPEGGCWAIGTHAPYVQDTIS